MNTSITINHDGINILVQWKPLKATPVCGITWKGTAKGEGEDGSEWESEVEGEMLGSLFVISKYFSPKELWSETIKQN